MKLLDTDIATLAYRRHPKVLERLASQGRTLVAIPVVTRIEILRGRIDAIRTASDDVQLLRASFGLADSEAFLSGFSIINIDDRVAAQFKLLRSEKRLRKIGLDDLVNACIALAHKATLVTRNTKDFQNVPGLKLENWAD